MCGIAGWVAPTASAPEERALQPMLDALYHRGPDGAGSCFYSAERGAYRVALGHRRLAIIDPNGSRQPMLDDAAGLALTFNGEIYNFRELRAELEAHGHAFERDSDTEVLLRAYQQWGTQCVNRLRGQFTHCVPHCWRSEEHTSELQSRLHLVCRLLLEKKKKKNKKR